MLGTPATDLHFLIDSVYTPWDASGRRLVNASAELTDLIALTAGRRPDAIARHITTHTAKEADYAATRASRTLSFMALMPCGPI